MSTSPTTIAGGPFGGEATHQCGADAAAATRDHGDGAGQLHPRWPVTRLPGTWAQWRKAGGAGYNRRQQPGHLGEQLCGVEGEGGQLGIDPTAILAISLGRASASDRAAILRW